MTTLVDTGPIVAFLNRKDRHHQWAVESLDGSHPPLLTCEAVLSEAVYLVRRLPGGPETVMELVTRGVLNVSFPLGTEAGALKRLVARYGGRPMDLADACLTDVARVSSGWRR